MELLAGKHFDTISLQDFLEHIRAGLSRQRHGKPAFTLLVGAGFSAPLIPTTREMVERDIAWWLFCQERQEPAPFRYCPPNEEEFKRFAAQMWKNISDAYGGDLRLKE